MLQTLPHDTTRLSTLNDIIKIEQNNYKCIQYSDSLMQEALKLKNDKYASLAAIIICCIITTVANRIV